MSSPVNLPAIFCQHLEDALIGGFFPFICVNANGGYEIHKQKAVHRNLTFGTEAVFVLSEKSDGIIRLLGSVPMLID